MLALKYLLMILGFGLFGSAGALIAYDVFLATHLRRLLQPKTNTRALRVGHRPQDQVSRLRCRARAPLAKTPVGGSGRRAGEGNHERQGKHRRASPHPSEVASSGAAHRATRLAVA